MPRVALGFLPGGVGSSLAIAVSGDGSAVAGWGALPYGPQAFRWTETGGMLGLGYLPGGDLESRARAISADGGSVVGEASSANGFEEAFLWSEAAGIVGLCDLPGGMFSSLAFDVSADGSVVVGRGANAAGFEAFLWTEAGGMVGLGDLPGGGHDSDARAVSDDGKRVVGRADGNVSPAPRAFLWTPDDGMRLLQQVLVEDYGLDLTGWTLREATDISADGNTIVGWGINPAGLTEAWVAAIPEPSTAPLLALGLALLAAKAGRRRPLSPKTPR
jgi:probable HAF family extracellular repeat protein